MNTARNIELPATHIEISQYTGKAPKPYSTTTSRGIKKATAAEPIRDPRLIKEIEDYLLTHGKTKWYGLRNRMAFVLGTTTGLRASDILNLRIRDVLKPDGTFHSHPVIREQKTHKTNDPKLGSAAIKAIIEYLNEGGKDYSLDDYLIRSERGGKLNKSQLYRIIHEPQKALGLEDHLSTHSMRKTYGYHTIRNNPDDPMALVHLQSMFNHSSVQTTLTYCGISRDEEDKYYDEMNAMFD